MVHVAVDEEPTRSMTVTRPVVTVYQQTVQAADHEDAVAQSDASVLDRVWLSGSRTHITEGTAAGGYPGPVETQDFVRTVTDLCTRLGLGVEVSV